MNKILQEQIKETIIFLECVNVDCGSRMSGIVIRKKVKEKDMIVQNIDNLVQRLVTATRLKKKIS